ncbi:MAG: HesA/MoeB/ThiF family protein [Syntrophomonadaceae bacterium]|nr:HesA/MoeB/ThiF family protein [Syntrophomonadaceae bacterium]MDD3890437.1 HesA/MoeB/ThiF family protein [Syntrophomonadaceae bacterium]MDD4549663.1 HesA/MoeB/ThiF family protein [Syntrophomonadaceae bacterium]
MPYLKWRDAQRLAELQKKPAADVERTSLEQGVLPLRYARNSSAISLEEQKNLGEARVGVCGCGGLGLYVVDQLARMGVGQVTVWDPDVFEEHNLNRQLLANMSTLGMSKVECARRHVEQVNPTISLTTVQKKWQASETAFIAGHQVLVDALDNIPVRKELAQFCANSGIPLVSGAVGGWYGQIAVLYPGDATDRYLYGENPDPRGLEKEEGTLPFAPAVIASIEVAEVVKILINRGQGLKNKICMVNLLDMEFDILDV